ncbi:olfactory receptor 5AR1-like [Alligator mississippiensis]|uniref:olfactory receptor 5AR1-like n=1 Tax=Alligator mississippiensis TaxID=8496 RepID=UPI0003D0784D|nr:olfactory receptor 5AR1-like [Alligator mississippiensis]
MVEGNYSMATDFIFLGFMDHPELWVHLFMLFLGIYVVTLVGNLGIILLIRSDYRLHTPMYFFLSNLSLVDAGNSSVVAPRLLMTFIMETTHISLTECATQFFFVCTFLTNECCLLAAMAYDRFIAICNPLLYNVIMTKRLCVLLVVSTYMCSFLKAMFQTPYIFSLSFCSSNIINHFFCDIPPILKLSCSDTHMANLVHFIFSTMVVMISILIILLSYMYIFITILRIRSAKGRSKAFSTCASHLMAVSIFYGTVIFIYLRPNYGYPMDQDKIVSVFYILVIPLLNPLIYSLRNKEVKEAFRRMVNRKLFP